MRILGEFVGHELVVTITVLARLTLAIAADFGSLTVKATCNGFVLLFLRASIKGSQLGGFTNSCGGGLEKHLIFLAV